MFIELKEKRIVVKYVESYQCFSNHIVLIIKYKVYYNQGLYADLTKKTYRALGIHYDPNIKKIGLRNTLHRADLDLIMVAEKVIVVVLEKLMKKIFILHKLKNI